MLLERMTKAIESSTVLERVAATLTRPFTKLRPGPLKDALSGSWLRHPAHPMLTDVPIGAWTAAFVFDLIPGRRSDAVAEALIAMGLVTTAPTAVTGFTELADVGDRPAKRVGGAHAVANLLASSLYATSLLLRRRGATAAGKVAAMVGAGVFTAGAFLGGHLTYRHGVGVNQTAFEPDVEGWTPVADELSLDEGKPIHVSVDGVGIVLVRSGGMIRALADRCSHRGGPLHRGEVRGDTIVCPWHASAFRLHDGEIERGPASAPQPHYDVRMSEGRVEVRSA